MLLSDGGLFFPLNSQMKIYVPRDRELVRLSVCVCVWAKEHRRARVCGSGSPQLQCFTPAGTGEGHPEQNGAYANVPQLRPSARQTGLLPGNASLRSPGPYGTRRICVNHAWPHLVSWIKHTRPLGARHSEVAMTMTMMMLMSDLMTCFLWGYSVLPYCQQITEKKPKANNALMQLWVTNLTPGAARCTTIILLVCSFCPLYAGWSIMPKMCDNLNILLSVLSSQSCPM